MLRKSLLPFLALTLLLTACGNNQSSPATVTPATTSNPSSTATPDAKAKSTGQQPGKYQQSLEFEGYNRTYLLYLPTAITNQKPLPVLFVFHGGEGEGKQMEGLTGFTRIAEQRGFIVVYPDAVDKNWNDGRESPFLASQRKNVNDTGFISALIDQLERTYKIDQNRIFATGMSNGGIFSQMVGCELSGKIAAIAPVSGTLAEKLAPNCKPDRAMPVLEIHGIDDPLVPWQGGAIIADKRGTVLSVPDTIKKWVTFDSCNSSATVERLPDTNTQDGTQVRRETYSGCKTGSEVILYAVEGGGHTWPGGPQYAPERLIGKTNRDINASEVIWDFFTKHPFSPV